LDAVDEIGNLQLRGTLLGHSVVGFGGGGLAPTDSRTDYTLLSLRSEISVLATRENCKLKPEENDK